MLLSLLRVRHKYFASGVFCLCRKPPQEYFPSFDLRDLSTLEELAWATGMDPTGGKEVTSNIFDRSRLKAREVGLATCCAPPLYDQIFPHARVF